MNPNIVVVGSLNADLVVRVDRFPAPGETLRGRRFDVFAGGKGGNQAAAAARLGGHVAMVGQVGGDAQGAWLRSVARGRRRRRGVRQHRRRRVERRGADHDRRRRVRTRSSSSPAPTAHSRPIGSRRRRRCFARRRSCCCSWRSRWPRSSAPPPKRAPRAPSCCSIPRRPPTSPDQLLALASLVTPNESELAALAAAPLLDGPTPDDEIDRRAAAACWPVVRGPCS